MSENIFHEVDEEVRREKLRKIWERYEGTYLLGLAVLFVLAVGGWRGYEWYETKRSQEAGAAFEAAAKLSEEGKQDEALSAFAKVSVEGNAGYRALARLREADELARLDRKAALAAFDKLAGEKSNGKQLVELASIRAAFLALDLESPEQLRQRAEPMTGPDRIFRHSARELLALSAWRNNDLAALKKWNDAIVADAETPGSIRARVEMLMALLAAGGKG